MSNQRPLLVQKRIGIATYEIDYAQIVHNSVYIRWLEDLRLLLLADHYPFERMMAERTSPILTRTEIDYLLPVRFGDDLCGRMWVKNLTRVRWTVQAEFCIGEQRNAVAVQHGYLADLDTLKPVRIPAALSDHWRQATSR